MSLSTDTSPGEEARRLERLLTDRIDEARFTKWIGPVNMACARPLEGRDLASRIMAILVMVGDLPAAAFTLDSARRVRAVGFPSAAAIRTAVGPAVRALNDDLDRARKVPGVATARATSSAGRWAAYQRQRLAGEIPGMPPADERHLLSLVRTQAPLAIDRSPGASRDCLSQGEDREWWESRIRSRLEDDASPEFHRSATMRWREARGMIATLTSERAVVRQWAVDRLVGIMRQAEDEGADATGALAPASQVDPRAPARGLFGDPALRVPFSDPEAIAAAREEARPAGVALTPRPLSRDALAAAYAAVGTGPAAYRAAQLEPPTGDHHDE